MTGSPSTAEARRRHLLANLAGLAVSTLALPAPRAAARPGADARSTEAEWNLLVDGVTFLLRHAEAPGTDDLPRVRLDDCATQRNLDVTGIAPAVGEGIIVRGADEAHGLQVLGRIRP